MPKNRLLAQLLIGFFEIFAVYIHLLAIRDIILTVSSK